MHVFLDPKTVRTTIVCSSCFEPSIDILREFAVKNAGMYIERAHLFGTQTFIEDQKVALLLHRDTAIEIRVPAYIGVTRQTLVSNLGQCFSAVGLRVTDVSGRRRGESLKWNMPVLCWISTP